MAEQEVQEVENDQELDSKEKNEIKVDDELALMRFMWLRSLRPFYTNETVGRLTRCWHSGVDLAVQEHIKAMAASNPSNVASFIKKAIQSNLLSSLDEALWCVAYCLFELRNEGLSKELRQHLLQFTPTSADLLFFVTIFKIETNAKVSFPRSMRTFLEKWYDSRSPSELLELVFATDKLDGVGHELIVRKLHLSLENPDKNEIIKAAGMKYAEIKAAAETSTTMKKILKYKDLKRCTKAHEVLSILKRKDFTYKLGHLPKNALKSPEVIEQILPNLSLGELLANLVAFCNHKMLRVQDVSKKICNALQCSKKVVAEAKLSPLYVFGILKTIEKKLTIPEVSAKSENGAAASTAAPTAGSDNKAKEKKMSNPLIIKRLQEIFNQTFAGQPKTGCRFYVTVDFRKFSKNQSEVFGMSDAPCSEVQAIVALSLLKNEKDVTVMTFTDEKNKLKPVAWTAETSFDKAMEIYEKEIKEKPKTKENILLPLKKAAEDKKKVDVFITFVSSVGRTLGKNAKPPIEQLEDYRKAMNLNMTKLVVVNLTRKKPDFKYDNNDINAKGFLEIVGFSSDSMKIIEAFAKNCFV